ncbi:TRAP transporter substrate-binding protein [Nesterenkonia muleiensis]|uniref:TRAP transporter substrate-binding protein n=1 Tax=Nesterenkonia muleiensis TaxID=2282648 RepID=UPI0013004CEE|nr:TRAP transporter substrate-binding protein [Nesterenkonia muleiensis]
MSRIKRSISVLVGLPLLVLTACGATGDEGDSSQNSNGETVAEGSLRLGHVGSPGDVFDQSMDILIEELDEATEGRWTIEQYGSSQLGDERELIESVSMRTVDMALVTNAPIGNFVPEALFYDLPGLYQDIEHVEAVNNSEIVREYLAEALLAQDLRLLEVTHGGFRNMTNNSGPVETLDDLSGLSMRVQESPMINATYAALDGVTSVPIPMSEVYTALEQGVANAQENPAIMIRDFDLYEVQDFMTITEHSFFPRYILINEDVWQGIPEADQDLFLQAALEAAEFKNAYYVDETEQAIDELIEGGMNVNEPPEEFHEEFSQLMLDEVYPQFYEQIGGGDAEEGERIIQEIIDLAD